jgi:hypothetical protein
MTQRITIATAVVAVIVALLVGCGGASATRSEHGRAEAYARNLGQVTRLRFLRLHRVARDLWFVAYGAGTRHRCLLIDLREYKLLVTNENVKGVGIVAC